MMAEPHCPHGKSFLRKRIKTLNLSQNIWYLMTLHSTPFNRHKIDALKHDFNFQLG